MPELPDIVVYIESLEARILGKPLERVKILNPFVLGFVMPALEEAHEKPAYSVYRLGKRVVIGLQPDYFLVIHLLVAVRFRWLEPSAKPPGKIRLARFPSSPIPPMPPRRLCESVNIPKLSLLPNFKVVETVLIFTFRPILNG